MNHKEPNEVEYHEWSRRILEDIEEASSKLEKLKLTKRLIFDRSVILDNEGRIDYELSLNLWTSKNVSVDPALEGSEQQINFVLNVNELKSDTEKYSLLLKGKQFKKMTIIETIKKKNWKKVKIKARIPEIIVHCHHGKRGIPWINYETKERLTTCDHGTQEVV